DTNRHLQLNTSPSVGYKRGPLSPRTAVHPRTRSGALLSKHQPPNSGNFVPHLEAPYTDNSGSASGFNHTTHECGRQVNIKSDPVLTNEDLCLRTTATDSTLGVTALKLSSPEKESLLAERARAIQLNHEEMQAEREKSEKKRERTMRDLDSIKISLEEKENELSRREVSPHDHPLDQSVIAPLDVVRELSNLRRDIESLRPNTSRYKTDSPTASPQISTHGGEPPRVSFREALETVPNFDGYNIPLTQFAPACRRARDIIHPTSEGNLTHLLVNKLRGRAYYAVEDEPCRTVTEFLDLLNRAFGSHKTIDQYRGELSTIFLRPREHILDYITRVKDLRTSILDAERREHGTLDEYVTLNIDALTARSFCEGLPLEFRIQLSSDDYNRPFEAFAHVKDLAKRRELDRERYEQPRRNDNPLPRADLHPIGRPLAHSTPLRPLQDTYNNYRPPNNPRTAWEQRYPSQNDRFNNHARYSYYTSPNNQRIE
ncbi:PREDICTED: uncharacterized protein LOC106745560, partial [Dinoponera quadriceps]|uniref:Uncharacterized protein LOC106745560 n=1 Tax=Dinoponera quadriceps TaxID=609295 RepID=A0A6P3XFS5_DINQU